MLLRFLKKPASTTLSDPNVNESALHVRDTFVKDFVVLNIYTLVGYYTTSGPTTLLIRLLIGHSKFFFSLWDRSTSGRI
ncbi:hypothetical protein BDR03DRAFT_962467, partial [Suillus americanus]